MKFKLKYSYLMLIMAITLAACAGYFSVIGLGKLFGGSALLVMVMASILEVAKVITTTALHKNWNVFGWFLNGFLSICIVVLMVVTSVGVYGFLSDSYQKTANSLEIHDSEMAILESKGSYFEKTIEVNEKSKESKYKRMEKLSDLRTTQENRVDSTNTGWRKRQFLNDIKATTKEIQKLTGDIDTLNLRNQALNDSINVYKVKSLELESTSEVAGEVGPLKFMAEVTGQDMKTIVNWLIILLVCVFDPLAVALILATNRAFDNEREGAQNDTPKDVPTNDDDSKPKKMDENITEGEEAAIEEEEIEFNDEFEEEEFEDEEDSDEEDVEDFIEEEVAEEIKEEVKPEIVESTPEPEVIKPSHVVTTGKVELQDIKEKKNDRGYSTTIPKARNSNTVQRIGSNKETRNHNNGKLIFKKRS